MIEFAPVEGGLFKRGFAGDTLNTCWYLRRLLPESFSISYATRVGNDAVSNEFVAFLHDAGIASHAVTRDTERTLGLYAIALKGAERHFSYWRENSAARRLADNSEQLTRSLAGVSLIYISGITLAVIGEQGRENLRAVLTKARAGGMRIVFDSNIRLRLWPNEATARVAIEEFVTLSDIALPSFDDEANLWKDKSPKATARRLMELGASEIVVKNGARSAVVYSARATSTVHAATVLDAIDTTAAGDSFNAAYLAARCLGYEAVEACKIGHVLAGEVIRHRGALAPVNAIEPVKRALANGIEK